MPINININHESPPESTKHIRSTKGSSHRSYSDKSVAIQRPRTAISLSHTTTGTYETNNHESIDRLTEQAMNLSLSPRQLRCPACMIKFHSEFARDEHYCRSNTTKSSSNINSMSSTGPKRFTSSTATTVRSPFTNQVDSSLQDVQDFDVSINHISNDLQNDYSTSQSASQPHSEQVYYRKLAELNAECQRLQTQRDHLLEAHQRQTAQQTEQWNTHLNSFKDRVTELERKLRSKEESWQTEKTKLMEKLDATYQANKQQRDDIVRLIDQHENHRRLIDSWKREKLAFEDEILALKRISREQENEASRQLDSAKHRHVELERAIAHWQSVAQLAEDSVVVARQQLEAAQSERRKREAAMREELVRVISEMKAKEQDWIKERSDAAQQLAQQKKHFERKAAESEKLMAVSQINEQQAKTELGNLQAEMNRMNETMKLTIRKHSDECERLQAETLKQAKHSAHEIERLSNKLADANSDKNRVELMLEQMIAKMEGLLAEKADLEMRTDSERTSHQREIDRLMAKHTSVLDDLNLTHRGAERAWNEDRTAMQARLNSDRSERQNLLRKYEELRLRMEEERCAKEDALKSLQDAEQVMRSWREEREREEELRNRDKRDRRERKEREDRHKQELADIRRQARQESVDRLTLDPTLLSTQTEDETDHWNIAITPLEQNGWNIDAQLSELDNTIQLDRNFGSNRSHARPNTAGGTRITVSQSPTRTVDTKTDIESHRRYRSDHTIVDLEIDELFGYTSRQHLSLSPGQSIKVQASDVDQVNITM